MPFKHRQAPRGQEGSAVRTDEFRYPGDVENGQGNGNWFHLRTLYGFPNLNRSLRRQG